MAIFKNKLLVIILLLVIQPTIAQNYQTVEDINSLCSSRNSSSNQEAEIIVDKILEKIGLFRNFKLQECPNINNVIAKNIVTPSGYIARYILYNPNFFKRLDTNATYDWVANSILVHEIGRHLNGHILNNDNNKYRYVLEADEFSGFVLARVGATLEEAQRAIQSLQNKKTTNTYPNKTERLLAIKRGWYRGNGKIIVIKEIDTETIRRENTTTSRITAQQVLSTYINAIGGQEKIMDIKTLIKNFTFISSSSFAGGDLIFTSNKTYLTPNKILLKTKNSIKGKRGSNKFTYLQLDGEMYYKKSARKWEKLENNDVKLSKNIVSYIYEYSMLVNNSDITYLGIKKIKSISCYAIQFPKREIVRIVDINKDYEAIVSETYSNIRYYNIDTGLLLWEKETSINKYAFKNRNKNQSTSQITTAFLDYKPIKGVLFSFRQEQTFKSFGKDKSLDSLISTAITRYSKILVNPTVKKSDFKI